MSHRYQPFISVIGISILLVILLLFPFGWLATSGTSNYLSEASKWNQPKEEQFTQESFQQRKELSQVSAIKGQVADEQGHPLSGYVVEAISLEDEVTYSAKTNQSGKFEFSNIHEGVWSLSVKFFSTTLERRPGLCNDESADPRSAFNTTYQLPDRFRWLVSIRSTESASCSFNCQNF